MNIFNLFVIFICDYANVFLSTSAALSYFFTESLIAPNDFNASSSSWLTTQPSSRTVRAASHVSNATLSTTSSVTSTDPPSKSTPYSQTNGLNVDPNSDTSNIATKSPTPTPTQTKVVATPLPTIPKAAPNSTSGAQSTTAVKNAGNDSSISSSASASTTGPNAAPSTQPTLTRKNRGVTQTPTSSLANTSSSKSSNSSMAPPETRAEFQSSQSKLVPSSSPATTPSVTTRAASSGGAQSTTSASLATDSTFHSIVTQALSTLQTISTPQPPIVGPTEWTSEKASGPQLQLHPTLEPNNAGFYEQYESVSSYRRFPSAKSTMAASAGGVPVLSVLWWAFMALSVAALFLVGLTVGLLLWHHRRRILYACAFCSPRSSYPKLMSLCIRLCCVALRCSEGRKNRKERTARALGAQNYPRREDRLRTDPLALRIYSALCLFRFVCQFPDRWIDVRCL